VIDLTPIVYLIDDDPAVLTALRRILVASGFEVAAFESSRAFLERADLHAAGCLVLDLAMPGITGLDLQRELAKRDCILPIIFLTGRGDVGTSVQAMKSGAVDFLTKPVDDEVLITAIRHAFTRNRALRRLRDEATEIERRLASLTQREREVFEHVVTGRLNKQIAAELGTVEKTVKFHRANVMKKMAVRTVADLVRLAERAGIKPARS
jgi:FixJ family two-component response regulator